MKITHLFNWLMPGSTTALYKRTQFRENFFILNWDTLEKVELFLQHVENWKHVRIVHNNTLQDLPFSYLSQCDINEKSFTTYKQDVFEKNYAIEVFSLMLKYGLKMDDHLIEEHNDDDEHPCLMGLGEFLISRNFSQGFLNDLFYHLTLNDFKSVEKYFSHQDCSQYMSLNGSNPNLVFKKTKEYFSSLKEQIHLAQMVNQDKQFLKLNLL